MYLYEGSNLNVKFNTCQEGRYCYSKMVRESSIQYKGRKVSSPKDGVELLREFLEDCDREKLIICCLDTKNQHTAIHTVSVGSLNSSIVHPRETFKIAILSNAASIIIGHNHLSGSPDPSNEDISITKRLQEAGKILGIDLIDHLIIGDDGRFVSLKERGII